MLRFGLAEIYLLLLDFQGCLLKFPHSTAYIWIRGQSKKIDIDCPEGALGKHFPMLRA
jgi:hypothetical protein